jgi:hypothetical protein
MKPSHILGRSAFVLMMGAIVLLLAIPARAERSDEVWLDARTHALHVAKAAESGQHDGIKYEPYLDQLKRARNAVRRGDEGAAYAAMNRLMEMLENREYGIAPELADWLFNYCAQVTPPQFHDISRHIQKV